MQTLNAAGINALADWLLDNHYRGAQIVYDGRIDAWATAVESDPDHMAEIRARDSVTGAPATMQFGPEHFA
jgi:hypothetical protein